MCTGTPGRILGKLGFNPKNLVPFDIPNTSPLSTSQALTVLLSHTSNPEFVGLCQGFHRPGPDFFFCSHCTEVVSLLQILDSIFGLFIVIHGLVLLVLGSVVLYLVVRGLG